MKASDGKMRLTDVATVEQLLRIIQSIPSPKAEPFKRWLAAVGAERIEETIDPEQARLAVESETGESVITPQNAVPLNEIVTDLIENISDIKAEE